MQTQSHLLINAVLARPLKQRGVEVDLGGFLAGAVLPDIPFFLLTLGYGAYYWWIAPLAPDQTVTSILEHMGRVHFFQDPVWIGFHNVFHAPLLLAAIGLTGWQLRRRAPRWGQRLLWFALGAGLHSVIDIFTHTSDGPLVFFPLNWRYRFASPISYWEGTVGRIFTVVEMVLDLVLLIYLIGLWWRQRGDGSPRQTSAEPGRPSA